MFPKQRIAYYDAKGFYSLFPLKQLLDLPKFKDSGSANTAAVA